MGQEDRVITWRVFWKEKVPQEGNDLQRFDEQDFQSRAPASVYRIPGDIDVGSIMAKISTMSEINDCLRGVVCGCHYRSDLLPGSAFNGALNPRLCVVEVVIRTVKPAVPAAVAPWRLVDK